MESTGKYWIPVWNILEPTCNLVLAHPKYLKAIIRSHMDSLSHCKANLESEILAVAEKFLPQINLVSTVPVIGAFSAVAIIGEISVDTEQIMALIQQADTAHFDEWMQYDNKAHRMKPAQNSFRLLCKSLRINCYDKGNQLETQYPNSPYIDAARNIVRFEVQCCYLKVYAMSKAAREKTGCSESELLYELLSYGKCADMIRHYFYKTIGKGNYFTLDAAIQMVHLQRFRDKKKQQIIDALRLVSESRGISKAKAKLQGEELEAFRHLLWELNDMGINPVTVPKRARIRWRKNQWGIGYMPNLLNAYYDELKHGGAPLTVEMKKHLDKYSFEDVGFSADALEHL